MSEYVYWWFSEDSQSFQKYQILVKMSGALESYVNRPVSVITADGRNFIGTLKVFIISIIMTLLEYNLNISQGFDQTINLILDETHERVFSASQGVEQVEICSEL